MKKSRRKKTLKKYVSMQTKIIGLVLSLVLFVISSLTIIYSYIEYNQVEESTGQLALQVAKTISHMPSIIEAFDEPDPAEIIQPIVSRIHQEVGAEFIVIGNKDSIRYAHPHPWKIGKKMVGGDNDPALMEGKYYTSKAVGTMGPSLRGKAPIFNDDGEIIGIVSVGFLIEDIKKNVFNKVMLSARWSIVLLALGFVGSILLAKNIRKDMLGLEPNEISLLFRERQAILQSIHEGVIAVDNKGYITMINSSAKSLLNLSDEVLNQPVTEHIQSMKMMQVLQSGEAELGKEQKINNRTLIVNRIPLFENDEVIGVVSSFSDKTEIENMFHTLSEVKAYSDELRAQTHEYGNRLYVISGLLQLNKIDEAIDLIMSESKTYEFHNRIIFNQIQDTTFQAILLGKLSVASEKKINFLISDESNLTVLPSRISPSDLITIVGNIIDNAFDAVQGNKEKRVELFVTDIGQDVVIEVTDNGEGIPADMQNQIFQKGFSTKAGSDRGFGLSLVKETVEKLNGFIELQSNREKGTTFSIFIPKEDSND